MPLTREQIPKDPKKHIKQQTEQDQNDVIQKVPLSAENKTSPDEDLAREIFRQLTQFPGLDIRNLEIQVNEGHVILGGTLGAPQAKMKVEDIASRVEGVKKIENHIEVISSLAHPYTDPWI